MSREFNLNLRKFDLNMIQDDSMVVAIGRRRTGKSIVIKDLMFQNRDIPFGNVISGTEEANQFYGDFVPKTYIYNKYSHDIILNIIKRQKEMIGMVNSGNPQYKKIDPRLFLILDDCLFDDRWTRDIGIRSCFMNGRHWKVMFLITMQYPLGIPPALRTNIDYTIIMREMYMSNRKRIYEHYAGCFPTFDMFCQVMNSLGEFECLIVSNNAASNKLEDQVFWYKANLHDDFKVGSKAYWKYHQENYNPDEREQFDVSSYRSSSKIINIQKEDHAEDNSNRNFYNPDNNETEFYER